MSSFFKKLFIFSFARILHIDFQREGDDVIIFQLMYKKFKQKVNTETIFYFKVMCINVCDCDSPDVGAGNQVLPGK